MSDIIVTDKDKLDAETDMPYTSTNNGSNGCTTYMLAKTKNEASARLIVIFQK